MRINSGTIGMESARSYTSETTKSYHSQGLNAGAQIGANKGDSFKDWINGHPKQQGGYFHEIGKMRNVVNLEDTDSLESIKTQCMMLLLSLLEGAYRGTNAQDASYYHAESETTSFDTQGKVVTADGREIDFKLEMQMSRSFSEYYEVNLIGKQLNVCDPLVINLKQNVATVSDQKFLFDIDADGTQDVVSQLSGGSGYLALDQDGDGRIKDGSELFGTKSGNGFADLAQYDADKNGWIDENDAIWKKLRIWSKDENGKDQLYHIAEKGVGAICLQHVKTEFALHAQKDNSTNALIRNTGIFLYENGNVGTVQHLDMVR
ncbi:MAG: VCBS repeat-containing protein [Lachnospiraceae bacterium]